MAFNLNVSKASVFSLRLELFYVSKASVSFLLPGLFTVGSSTPHHLQQLPIPSDRAATAARIRREIHVRMMCTSPLRPHLFYGSWDRGAGGHHHPRAPQL